MSDEINGFDFTDVLLKASELVAEPGRWIEGKWFYANGQDIDRETAAKWDAAGVRVSVCALGALSLAADRLGVPERVVQGARSRLAWFLRKSHNQEVGVAYWNDHAAGSADEVSRTLREAAEGNA